MTTPDTFSERFPPKNRVQNDRLSVIEIEIAHADGVLRMDMNAAAIAGVTENLKLGAPLVPSVLSGEPGYLYRSSEVELALTKDELYRFMRHDLTAKEFFKLAEHFGVFFEIHSDFYDEDSGAALQPRPRGVQEDPLILFVPPSPSPEKPDIVITTSTQGDWVRVSRGDKVLHDDHSISPQGLADILISLGFTVKQEEKHSDDLG